MQDHQRQAMDELVAAFECIRRASQHLARSGDVNTSREDIAARSLTGALNMSERWCVETIVAVNARATAKADA